VKILPIPGRISSRFTAGAREGIGFLLYFLRGKLSPVFSGRLLMTERAQIHKCADFASRLGRSNALQGFAPFNLLLETLGEHNA
jgi:hypothetical protein